MKQTEFVQRSSIRISKEKAFTVTTWNLGYAGLGADADFKADGGKSLRFSDRKLVEANLEKIISQIDQIRSDVFCLQEVSRFSWINHYVDCLSPIQLKLQGYDTHYTADLYSRFLPYPFSFNMGLALLSNYQINRNSFVIDLPGSKGFIFGKKYKASVTNLIISGSDKQLYVINIHFSAFDEAGALRISQMNQLLRMAQEFYTKGNYVVIAGDWNMKLTQASFPHKTSQEHLSWIEDIPVNALPENWQLIYDPSVPTVRTLHKAYIPGENYVTIIDGFLISPNIDLLNVQTSDLSFEFTDHHPVTAKFRLR